MGLMEFLRQWQRGRLSAGVVISVLLHLVVIAALWGARLPSKEHAKRGEPLIVELPKLDDSPPPGSPGPERAMPRAAPVRPAPRVAPAPPVPKAVAEPAPRPSEPQRPTGEAAPRQDAERRVASAPIPTAPDGDAPAPSKVDRPKPAEPPPADRPAEDRAEDVPPAAPQPQVASLPQPSQPAAPAPNILTALRRGGVGGAGGSGHGRGGIEGEPIPLESTDPRYSDYLEQLRRMLQAQMTWPCDKISKKRGECEDRDEDLFVVFGIFKSGQLAFIELQRRSRQPIYDEFSENVIKLASPFPPVPAAMLAAAKPGSSGVPIAVHFRYVYSVTYRMLLMP